MLSDSWVNKMSYLLYATFSKAWELEKFQTKSFKFTDVNTKQLSKTTYREDSLHNIWCDLGDKFAISAMYRFTM